MAESPRRVDLRLTISAFSPYRELAGELAEKFAEYTGQTGAGKADVVQQVLGAVDASSGREIDITLAVDGNRVVVTTAPAARSHR